MKLIITTLVLHFSILLSCQHVSKATSPIELKKYIRDKKHGLLQEKDVNGITVTLQYQPSSLLIAQECQSKMDQSSSIDSLQKKYGSNLYFILKFSRRHQEVLRQVGSFASYSQLVSIFSFQLSKFIKLTTPEKDTVGLSDFFFDQTYGASDGNTVLLAFPKDRIEKEPSLQVNLAEFGLGIGSIKFSFKKEDIQGVPLLKYSRS